MRTKFIQYLHLAFFVMLCTAAPCLVVQAQTVVDPSTFPAETNPQNSNFEFYSRKGGTNKRATFDDVRKRMGALVRQPEDAGYTPDSMGNAFDRGYFLRDGEDVWYVDGLGNGLLLNRNSELDTRVDTAYISSDTLRLVVKEASTGNVIKTILARVPVTGGADLSWLGASSPVTLQSSSGTDVRLRAGANITLAAAGDSLTITGTTAGTDLSFSGTTSPITLQSSTGADVVFKDSTGINIRKVGSTMTILNTGDTNAADDITGTLASTQMPYGSGPNTVTGNSGFVYTGIRTLNFHTGQNNAGRSRINFTNNGAFSGIGSGIHAVPSGASARVNLNFYGGGDTSNVFYTVFLSNGERNVFSKMAAIKDSIGIWGATNNVSIPQICFASTSSNAQGNYNAKIMGVPTGSFQMISQLGFAMELPVSGSVSATTSDLCLYVNTTKNAFAPTGMMVGATSTPVSQLQIIGDGTTSASYPLIVTNSGGATATATLAVRDDGVVGIGTNAPSQELEVVGDVVANHLQGRGSAPSVTVNTTTCGTGATASVVGFDLGFVVTVTFGTTPSAVGGELFTLNYNTALPGTGVPVMFPGDDSGFAADLVRLAGAYTANADNTDFQLWSNGDLSTFDSDVLKFNFVVIAR